MADDKKDTRVTQAPEDAAGVSAAQVEPTADRKWSDVKADMTHDPDKELHPSGEPKHAADRTSIPGPEYPPAERPPVSTTRPDKDILRSLVTGAGAHEPPDPEKYDADGRPRDV
jgi:hypothetical protein